jgi:CheY-like chemotaxis protein
MPHNKSTILALSSDYDTRMFFFDQIKRKDVNLLVRQTRELALHLLSISYISLIIIDRNLEDCTGLELIQEIKQSDLYFNDTPIYALGHKDKEEEECIEFFKSGADDYSASPVPPSIFQARVNKLLDWSIKQKNNPVKLSTQMDSKEIPGIFQLLETEQSTGILQASHSKEYAQAILHNGKIIEAHTEYCTGKDAITEILAWPFAQIKFTENADAPDQVDKPKTLNISAALMDCVLDVDIYNDAKKRLDDTELAFVHGTKSLPSNSNRVAKQVVTMANSGLSLGEIYDAIRVNKRHLTLMIDQMIKAGYIKIAPPPFDDYLRDNGQSLRAIRTTDSLEQCKEDLSKLRFPLSKELSEVPYASASILIDHSQPSIILAGDNSNTVKRAMETMLKVAANSSQVHAKTSSQRKGEKRTTLIFDKNTTIDLVCTAQKLDHHYLSNLQKDYPTCASIIYCISSLDNPSNQANHRNLRKLRNVFSVPFTVALLSEPAEGYEPTFTFECGKCTHKLKIEMNLEDSIGDCPICSTEVKTPDCLAYAKDKLHIADNIPIVTLPARSDSSWSALMSMICDDILDTQNYR